MTGQRVPYKQPATRIIGYNEAMRMASVWDELAVWAGRSVGWGERREARVILAGGRRCVWCMGRGEILGEIPRGI